MYKEAQIQKNFSLKKDEWIVFQVVGHSVRKTFCRDEADALAVAKRHAGDNINYLPPVVTEARKKLMGEDQAAHEAGGNFH